MVDISSECVCLVSPRLGLELPLWHLTRCRAKGHDNRNKALLRLYWGIKGGAGVAALTLWSPWQCLSWETPFPSIRPCNIKGLTLPSGHQTNSYPVTDNPNPNPGQKTNPQKPLLSLAYFTFSPSTSLGLRRNCRKGTRRKAGSRNTLIGELLQ